MKKIKAGIDIGTNTILLLIAKVSGSKIEVLEDHVTVVRLGQGVDKNKAFHPEALDRARACFSKYRKILDQYPGIEIHAIATSGSRDAKNSPEFFQEVLEKFQIPVRVISGEEEAMLSFRGAVPGGSDEGVAVLDIGGGSSEIVGMKAGELFRFSFDMGCVRLSERFLQHDPALPSEIESLKKFVDEELGKQENILAKVRGRKLIGVAGTATYLASSHLGLEKFLPEKVDGAWVGISDVESLIKKFAPLSAAERLGIGGMDKGRADVILAGAYILLAILKKAELKGFEASVRGLRYGAIL